MLKRDRHWILFNLAPDQFSWRGVCYLLGVYVGSLLFAAVVTAPIYDWVNGPVFAGIHRLAEIMPWDGFAYLTKERSFDKYFDRLRMLPVLAGLPWLLVVCGLFSTDHLRALLRHSSNLPFGMRRLWALIRAGIHSLRLLGANFSATGYRRFCVWFGIGAGMLLSVILVQLAFGSVELRASFAWSQLGWLPFTALLTGVAVALLEETVFRGLMLRIFYTAVRPLSAGILSALFFAYVHFQVPDVAKETLQQSDAWWLGFYVAFWMLVGIAVQFSLVEFLNLFVFGFLLNLVFLRTRSLLACMGLHAGAVWAIKFYNEIFAVGSDAHTHLWGGGKVIDGWLPLIIMCGICIYLQVIKDAGPASGTGGLNQHG